MSTVTAIDRFRMRHPTPVTTNKPMPSSSASHRDFGLLWNDVLATLSIVALASIVVYEALKIPLW